MRWIAGLLLVINIGYFIWSAGQIPRDTTDIELLVSNAQAGSHTSLTLLSELDELPPIRLAPPPSCWKLGLFNTEEEMMPIAERLAGGVADIQVHQREIRSKPQYWVILGPFDTLAIAEQELKALLATQNIDAFVIRDGPLKGGISLGRFNDGLVAQKELRRRKQQGFEVTLRTNETISQQFGAELSWPTLPPSEEALLAEISKRSRAKELPFIFLKKRCKSIASR